MAEPIHSSWVRAVEQLLLAADDGKTRVLGLLGPDQGPEVSKLCRVMAESAARSGRKTLLFDVTQPTTSSGADGWLPGEPALASIAHAESGYDVLLARPTSETRPFFNNVEVLRKLLGSELGHYDIVIVDMPAVLDSRDDHVNPVAVARACDAVVMLCTTGRVTQRRVKSAVVALRSAGVRLGATVMNDAECLTLGQQMAASARRWSWLSPRLASWAERKALASEFLNPNL